MSWGTKASMESIEKCLKTDYQIKKIQGYYAIQHKSPMGKGKNVLEFRVTEGGLILDVEPGTFTPCELGNFDNAQRLNYKGWTKDLRIYCSMESQVKFLMAKAYEYFENKYM